MTPCEYTYTITPLYTGAFMDYESPTMIYYRKWRSIADSVAIDFPNFDPTTSNSFNYVYIDENNSANVELLAYKHSENDYRLLNPYFGYRAIFSYGNTGKDEKSGTPSSYFDTLNLFMEDPLTKKVIPYYDFKRFNEDDGMANGNVLDINYGMIERENYYRIYQTYKPEFQSSFYNYDSSMLNTAPNNLISGYGTINAIYDRKEDKLCTLDTSPSSNNGEYRFFNGVNKITLINGILLTLIKIDSTTTETISFYKGFELIIT